MAARWFPRPAKWGSFRGFTTANRGVEIGQASKKPGWDVLDLIFYGIPIGTSFGLGTWQVQRLQQKNRMIDERKDKMNLAPVECTGLAEPVEEYRRVTVTGKFLDRLPMLVGPRSAPSNLPKRVLRWGGSVGSYVVSPMLVDGEGGGLVLVNRGWVPRRAECDLQKPISAKEVSVTGLVRGPDTPNQFTPSNSPAKDEWFWIDPPAMAAQTASSETHGRYVWVVDELLDDRSTTEMEPEAGLVSFPFPKDENEYLKFFTMPSTHVSYAATWYALCAALVVMTVSRLRKGRSMPR